MTNLLPDNLFPDRIRDLLRAISGVGFFERSVVIGSWVMLIHQVFAYKTVAPRHSIMIVGFTPLKRSAV
ncbi:MAG: hypothetical protein ACD_87C00311G0002 [uncultured bacterium]|nr:MAG: hypothetical protein ACD_87C00311G0002 [uncultured bacterium]